MNKITTEIAAVAPAGVIYPDREASGYIVATTTATEKGKSLELARFKDDTCAVWVPLASLIIEGE